MEAKTFSDNGILKSMKDIKYTYTEHNKELTDQLLIKKGLSILSTLFNILDGQNASLPSDTVQEVCSIIVDDFYFTWKPESRESITIVTEGGRIMGTVKWEVLL